MNEYYRHKVTGQMKSLNNWIAYYAEEWTAQYDNDPELRKEFSDAKEYVYWMEDRSEHMKLLEPTGEMSS